MAVLDGAIEFGHELPEAITKAFIAALEGETP